MLMETTTLELPLDLALALDNLASRTGQSRADVLRVALEALATRHQALPPTSALMSDDDPRWPRSVGVVDDAHVSGAEYEGWLRTQRFGAEHRGPG